MSTASSVNKVYKTVVDDVINSVKEAFLDEGVDEQVLTELRQLWESKMHASKALEEPQEVGGTVYTNPAIAVLHQQATSARVLSGAHQVQQQSMPVPIQLSAAPEMTGGGAAAAMALPSGLFQHQLSALNTGGLRLHQAGNGQYIALPIQQGGHGQVTTTISLPQQTVVASQAQGLLQSNAQTASRTLQQTMQNMIQQIDGAADTSSSEDEDFDNEDNEAESDEEQKEEEEQGAEEEPLNSDDDVSDEDPAEIFDTENVIVCQYDKINRNKNKWKFHLKDGIMNLGGRDYVFQRATGDAEW